MCMLEKIRKFLGKEVVKYVLVTVAFGYSVFLTWGSNFLLCLMIVLVYIAYDEKRNEGLQPALKDSHKKVI